MGVRESRKNIREQTKKDVQGMRPSRKGIVIGKKYFYMQNRKTKIIGIR